MVRHRSATGCPADRNWEGTECSWDTTPIAMRAWLQKLPEHLLSIDHDYALLWSQLRLALGAVLDRNVVCGPTNPVALKSQDGTRACAYLREPHLARSNLHGKGALPCGASALTTEDKKSSFKVAAILCSRKDFSLSRHTSPTRSRCARCASSSAVSDSGCIG